jgi:hypothetical protein
VARKTDNRRHDPFLFLLREEDNASWVIIHHGKVAALSIPEDALEEALEELKIYAEARRVRKDWEPTYFKPPIRIDPTIYFISSDAVPNFPVKIGKAYGDVPARLAILQVGCPYELTVLATMQGTSTTEKFLHIEFHSCRYRGEWFHRSPELMDFIAKLAKEAA